MPRVGLNTTQVVRAARDLADEVGLYNLTLTATAERLHVKLPSLYKHIANLQDLQQLIVADAQLELLTIMKDSIVGKAGADAVIAIATAMRQWAVHHPSLYEVMFASPYREGDAFDSPMLEFTLRILTSFNLYGDDAIDAARALRATLHGFISLEARGGFGLPADVDRSFHKVIVGLCLQLRNWHSIQA